MVPAFVVPTLRKPRSMGQPVFGRCPQVRLGQPPIAAELAAVRESRLRGQVDVPHVQSVMIGG